MYAPSSAALCFTALDAAGFDPMLSSRAPAKPSFTKNRVFASGDAYPLLVAFCLFPCALDLSTFSVVRKLSFPHRLDSFLSDDDLFLLNFRLFFVI